jgi:hypothetical protein
VNFARALLSGSTSGRPIKVVATASPGTTIHTAVAGSSSFDEVYLWATNTSGAAVALTIEFGGTTNPDDRIVNTYSLRANSPPTPIVTGQSLNGGLIVKAFAGSANVIVITGHVNRIAP